jgi:hypothetical protein
LRILAEDAEVLSDVLSTSLVDQALASASQFNFPLPCSPDFSGPPRMTDDEVLALAQPALKRMPGGSYRQAPLDKMGLTVPSKDVCRLVEKGALLWVNRCRSAAAKPPDSRSRANEHRVSCLQPVSAPAALVETARPLRHDPLEAHLAGFGEDDRALALDRLAEQDSAAASDQEPGERGAALLQRA